MELTARRRRVVSSVLAIVLAAESVSAVAAAGLTVRTAPAVAAPIAQDSPVRPRAGDDLPAATRALADVLAGTGSAAVRDSRRADAGAPARKTARTSLAVDRSSSSAAPAAARSSHKDRVTTDKGSTKAPSKSKSTSTTEARSSTVRSGRNHVWIPSLHINRSVSWFPCDRKRPPDNYVYRWGCAGSNNVYLLGHAYSVFKPLHDAYVQGRLRKGMKAYYADARGRVHTYRVRWWRVTAPTTAASWAWAAQGRPSMTLQTCVGKNSAYRLMVRLVEAG